MNLAAIVSQFLDTLMTLPKHSYDRGLLFPFVLSLLLITQESEGEVRSIFVSRYGALLPVPSGGGFFERNTRRGIRRDTRFFVIILIMF